MKLEDLSERIREPARGIQELIESSRNSIADIEVGRGQVHETENNIANYCALVKAGIQESVNKLNQYLESFASIRKADGIVEFDGRDIPVSVNRRRVIIHGGSQPSIVIKLSRNYPYNVKKITVVGNEYIVVKGPGKVYSIVSDRNPERFAEKILGYAVPHLRAAEDSEWYAVPLMLRQMPSWIDAAYRQTAEGERARLPGIKSEVQKIDDLGLTREVEDSN